MVDDFMEDIGEGAYFLDEENANDNEEHPTDVLINELEEDLCQP